MSSRLNFQERIITKWTMSPAAEDLLESEEEGGKLKTEVSNIFYIVEEHLTFYENISVYV